MLTPACRVCPSPGCRCVCRRRSSRARWQPPTCQSSTRTPPWVRPHPAPAGLARTRSGFRCGWTSPHHTTVPLHPPYTPWLTAAVGVCRVRRDGTGRAGQLGPQGFYVADDVRARVMCGGDDAGRWVEKEPHGQLARPPACRRRRRRRPRPPPCHWHVHAQSAD